MIKNPPAMWESWVRSVGREDPHEKGIATDSIDRGAWWASVRRVAKTQTGLSD